MVKSWRGAKEGKKSQWICHCRQNSLTNSITETPSLNPRLHSLGFLAFIAVMEQTELVEKEQPEYRGREQGTTAHESMGPLPWDMVGAVWWDMVGVVWWDTMGAASWKPCVGMEQEG